MTGRDPVSDDRVGPDEVSRELRASAMPARAIEAVERAAESVRAANHASLHRGDFDHHDLYRLVGELSTLAQRLPQLLDQAGDILVHLHAADRIEVDHGSLDDIAANWTDATSTAVNLAFDLARQIDRAFAQLSTVRARTSDRSTG